MATKKRFIYCLPSALKKKNKVKRTRKTLSAFVASSIFYSKLIDGDGEPNCLTRKRFTEDS